MHQLVQALPPPQTPTVLWTDVSKPSGTSLEDSTISDGSLLQTVQIYPLLFFSLTAQLGHILVVPKHKKFVSYYKCFGRVMDTNRPRLCLLVSIIGRKWVQQEPIFLSRHDPSTCQKLREGIPRCGYWGRL
jgi:hypothetical protein